MSRSTNGYSGGWWGNKLKNNLVSEKELSGGHLSVAYLVQALISGGSGTLVQSNDPISKG